VDTNVRKRGRACNSAVKPGRNEFNGIGPRVAFYHYDRIGWDAIFGQFGRSRVSVRFYCPDPPIDGRQRLGAGEAKHLSRVCRLGVGDVVEVFDGRGGVTRSEVIALGDDWVDLIAMGTPPVGRLPPFPLTLASAVPKGDRFDWLVEKATELGVERLIPIVTERAVVKPGGAKLSRLRRSIIEASKQCGRNRLMVLEAPVRWADLAESVPESLKFLADRHGRPAERVLPIPRGGAVILAVGPEGGFSDAERTAGEQAGWSRICLSTYTLRIETAGLAGCAALFARADESSK
jgi:16S rRNA (uracil1498-N3)-methyltransferase